MKTDLKVSLTKRELEILELVMEGLSNKDIASKLYVGVHTVKSHINTLFNKTGMNRIQLAVWASHYLKQQSVTTTEDSSS